MSVSGHRLETTGRVIDPAWAPFD